jgi:RluA family pseudouridine synthase
MYFLKTEFNEAFKEFDPSFHYIFQYKIPSDSILLDVLKNRYHRNFSQNYNDMSQFIIERIRVNGKLVDPNTKLCKNDIIQYLHDWADEKKSQTLKIIFENEYLLVIDKMPYQPMSPFIPIYFNSVIMQVKRQLPNEDIFPVHRLDTDTSGVLLLAKTKIAAKKFSELFLNNQIKKYYKTIVYGKFDESIREVSGKIVKDKSCFTDSKWKLEASENKESLSKISVIDSNKHFSELKIKPITGKTNQIRIHLASCGFPIIGDMKYYHDRNVYKNWFEEGLSDSRMILDTYILNCKKMNLIDPISENELLLESDQKDYQKRKGTIEIFYKKLFI